MDDDSESFASVDLTSQTTLAALDMALELIRTAPQPESFTPLAEHQAQTPGTFFGGKPVLYYHSTGAELSIDAQQLESSPAFSALIAGAANGHANGHSQTNIAALDVWVTSEYFILFSPTSSAGVQIPYPTISLHAQQSNALYMQLCLSEISQTADEDLETLELLLTPSAPAPATIGGTEERSDEERTQSSAQALYAAVSACADLHPDPDEDEEGAAAEQDQVPGAGGWITSENMNDFMDEDGNFRMPEALGAGAGTVRTADDAQFEDAETLADADDEDAKWRRTG